MRLRHPAARPAAVASAAVLTVPTVLAAAGCGVRPTGIIDAGSPPPPAGSAAAITVYLLDGDRLRSVRRPGTAAGRPVFSPAYSLPIEQLAVRPTAAERAGGLRTEVGRPLVARLLASGPRRPLGPRELVVDLPAEAPHRRVRWSREALAQIACTGEAIAGVSRVRLWSAPGADGSGWGVVRCDEFLDLLG